MRHVGAAVAALVVIQSIATPGLSGQASLPRVEVGELKSGDTTLRSGEYSDEYSFEGRAGQAIEFDLISALFDPYLIVVAPSGEKSENDDWQNGKNHSRVEMTLTETGRYRVIVTSYEKGESGQYALSIDAAGGASTRAPSSSSAPTPSRAATAAPEPGSRTESGRLAAGDRTISSGEYVDEFPFHGMRGERVTIDLRSNDFDPYVILMGPKGKVQENDDFEGDSKRSLVTLDLPDDGAYKVIVTSYEKGESGAYDLRIRHGTTAASSAAASDGPRIERGRLASGDQTLKTGEYMDVFTFEGQGRQRVTLDVASQDFDTYLMLIPPRGERRENDDVEGKPGHSVIEADITEPGTYKVIVTSYEKGSTGNYELNIGLRSAALPAAGDGGTRDVVSMTYGDTQEGRLSETDGRLTNGEYRDLYAFQGQAGDRVVVELASTEFDPYLVVIPPEGAQVDNDDADGRQDLSRVEIPLRASGRYRILTTSYEARKSGRYRLTVRRAVTSATPTSESTVPPPSSGGDRVAGRRVYGVFVGISDYGGRASNLRYTADDARRVQQAMLRGGGMREADSVVLVDRQATLGNIRRAVESVARQAGPEDMFVFFYSGHGSRVPRSGFQSVDPDGQDETLSFADADLKDDEMAQWLSGIRAGVSLIVLDSCFSGGFSKDIITARGRMGLFSSEEDVTSGVAVKFRAGGYLAQFIGEAVGDHLADEDRDGNTTAVELSQYLHDRYRADVKSGGSDEGFVRTGTQTGYQHLVVDRGGVGPYDVLFRGMAAR